MRTLVVTNDFPPRTGGIQVFVASLARRLPQGEVVVYAPAWRGAAAHDAEQPFPVVRHPTSLMLPVPSVLRRAREIARAERTGDPLCVALLDLDHFKAYNDAYGHQAGDAHLRRTAAAWRRELRAIDVLARYGGEEFWVLLPQCDPQRAREVIDRVRAATPNGETSSAGVVLYDGKESPESLLARADAALYRAKHAGRAVTVPA